MAAAATMTVGAVVGPVGAVVGPVGAAFGPVGASGAARHQIAVRPYDNRMLAHSNHARRSAETAGYPMNHKLWVIAHAWAKRLASTGALAHNPHFTAQATKKCPAWTAIGENVGVTYGQTGASLFNAYMHSPKHRANILDRRYHQVGIATVKVTRDGVTQEWDVMDFGNHC